MGYQTWVGALLLSSISFADPPPATLTEAPRQRASRQHSLACNQLFGFVEKAGAGVLVTDLGVGQARFENAVAVKEGGTGAKLAREGRAVQIPPQDILGLTEAFRADYEAAAAAPANSATPERPISPLARGNKSHMDDHIAIEQEVGADLSKALGLDRNSLRLAIAAHDIGKGFLDPALHAWTSAKLPKDGNFFVDAFVMSHEEHDIARVPQVVRDYLSKKGVDLKTPQGDKMWKDYSAQVIETIRHHNGVDITGDLSKKYPSLTAKERKDVERAWWAENYARYATSMELPKTKIGGQTNALADTLNYLDRATLTTKAAPWKLGNQNLGTMGFGPSMIEVSTIKAAEGNGVLMKAQADKLVSWTTSDTQVAQIEAVNDKLMKNNDRLIDFGKKLLEMNSPDALGPLNLSESELPNSSADKSIPHHLYIQRKSGEWARVVTVKGSAPQLQLRDASGAWKTQASPIPSESPMDLLMHEVVQQGMWPGL